VKGAAPPTTTCTTYRELTDTIRQPTLPVRNSQQSIVGTWLAIPPLVTMTPEGAAGK